MWSQDVSYWTHCIFKAYGATSVGDWTTGSDAWAAQIQKESAFVLWIRQGKKSKHLHVENTQAVGSLLQNAEAGSPEWIGTALRMRGVGKILVVKGHQ